MAGIPAGAWRPLARGPSPPALKGGAPARILVARGGAASLLGHAFTYGGGAEDLDGGAQAEQRGARPRLVLERDRQLDLLGRGDRDEGLPVNGYQAAQPRQGPGRHAYRDLDAGLLVLQFATRVGPRPGEVEPGGRATDSSSSSIEWTREAR